MTALSEEVGSGTLGRIGNPGAPTANETATRRLPIAAPVPVLAAGAWLKNRACRVDGWRASWSPPHGDLGEADACLALERSLDALADARGGAPAALAHDLHPDFHSTRAAVAAAAALGVPAIAVQHHHAHIATTVALHGIDTPVIGLALDGVGLGSDGEAWGGELLRVDGGRSAHRWTRLAHLEPIRLPGGDRAVGDCWRLAAGVLHDTGRGAEIGVRFGAVVGERAADVVRQMLERDVNCPRSSSAGRWFDAAAAALGLCLHQNDEAEAARTLEHHARIHLRRHPDDEYPWPTLDLRPLVAELSAVAPGDADAVARGAAAFHLALVDALARAATAAARERGIDDVVLGGGCFLNRILRDRLSETLRGAGLRVHVPEPALLGDAGLALGQAWVAACAVSAEATACSGACEIARSRFPTRSSVEATTCPARATRREATSPRKEIPRPCA